jgi:hypothetical protein
MENKAKFFQLIRIIIIFIVLFSGIISTNFIKFEITERITNYERAKDIFEGIKQKTLQNFIDYSFNKYLSGFRSILIVSQNEIQLNLFKSRPNKHYIRADNLGFYPVDTIKRLNWDFIHKQEVEDNYQKSAGRLKELQNILLSKGVNMIVVVAPPKAKIYPEFIEPYLVEGAEKMIGNSASYSKILRRSGVEVFDAEEFFITNKKESRWPFYSYAGFHWSTWAGCLVTQEIAKIYSVNSHLF